MEFLRFTNITIEIHCRADSEQLSIAVIFCIHISQHMFQKSQIRHQIIRELFRIKQEVNIINTCREQILVKHGNILYRKLFVGQRECLSADILPLQHRDLLQIFLWGWFILILFQLFCKIYNCLLFFCGQIAFICIQLFLQFFCLFCLQTWHRF